MSRGISDAVSVWPSKKFMREINIMALLRRPLGSLAMAVMLLVGAGANVVTAQPASRIDGACVPGGGRPALEAVVDQSDYIRSLEYASVPARYRDFRGLLIEETLVKELYPVLTSVFFDAGRAEMPERYTIFTDPSQTEDFDETRIPGRTIERYHQILNIIGYRLRTHPETKISIAGYDARQPASNETGTVAEARAMNVYTYLINIWRIDPRRITMAPSGGYPRVRSDIGNPTTGAENQRVEILSDDWEIIRPVVATDFRRSPDPNDMRFRMRNGIADSLIVRREIAITRSGKPWHTLTKIATSDSLSPKFNWGKGGFADSIPNDEAPYVAELVLYLKDGRQCRSRPIEIPVMIITDERKRRDALIDETRDIYTLFLFGFERSDLGALEARILREYIALDIRTGARIYITGYSSSEPHGKKLSAARATAVAAALRKLVKPGIYSILESEGVGDEHRLYNDDLPEGRFYNRTVQVRIVTPTRVEE